MSQPRHIRIFLSSPSDVADERVIARKVITNDLPADPLLREEITTQVIAWEDPLSRTAMIATLSPQEAIDLRLPKPSDCDIVVVILWSRMGTPLDIAKYRKSDGSAYLSGTEWEYENAMVAARKTGGPMVLVYRRIEVPEIKLNDSQRQQKIEQYDLVESFFAAFRNPDGIWKQSYTEYETPELFRQYLEADLKTLIKELLRTPKKQQNELVTISKLPQWNGSPFPGLRAFTPADAPIFFGRGRETDALVQRVKNNRFVAVVGASGSGKSSLVGAGLIPRLKGNAVEGSKDWLLPKYEVGQGWSGVRFTPGEMGNNPFGVLAAKLAPLTGDISHELAETLTHEPAMIQSVVERALIGKTEWAEILVFIDQFEELFTLAHREHIAPFAALLSQAAQVEQLRIVVTMRSDFYHRCVDVPLLVGLFDKGAYPLAAPDPFALLEMIERPAERAGLLFEGDLARKIVYDTGSEPGALALLAYTLDELYHARSDNVLTGAAYEMLGRVSGAIGRRAESIYALLDTEAQAALRSVFRELVEVDERGTAMRHRASLERIIREAAAERLVKAFVGARLLTTNLIDDRSVVEVAHEALFRSWERLADWLEATAEDFRQVRLGQIVAREWERSGWHKDYWWEGVQLERLEAAYQAVQPELQVLAERLFFRHPTHDDVPKIIKLTTDERTPPYLRSWGGVYLSLLSDPRPGVGLRSDGLPDIEWDVIPAGTFLMGSDKKNISRVSSDEVPLHKVTLPTYSMSRYPITCAQFQVFLDTPDGFANPDWWEGLTADMQHKNTPAKPRLSFSNHPRTDVSWYDAIAFCRWLSAIVGYKIMLPTEAEWEKAARGIDGQIYPYGNEYDPQKANTYETGIGKTSAVGIFPKGASPYGVLDMSGNVWEWCLTKWRGSYTETEDNDLSGNSLRVVRGGAFHSHQSNTRTTFRYNYRPELRSSDLGFRVICHYHPLSQ